MNYLRLALLGLLLFQGVSVYSQTFYEVDTPEEAQVKLWFVEDESQCDLRVSFVYDPKEANKTGHWCEVPTPEEADVKTIFVDDPALADLNLCMTMNSAKAGWLNEEKKTEFPMLTIEE
jgi:hypothetical protein